MIYRKNDIVTCKNGYDYVITKVNGDEYSCIPLMHYNSPYKIHGKIKEENITKLTGRVYKGCIIL